MAALRLTGTGASLGDGDLLGSDLGIGERSLSLAETRLGLLHDFLRRANAGLEAATVALAEAAVVTGLIVLLLGDFFFADESFITRQIGVGVLGLGLRLNQSGFGFLDLLDGGRDSGLGVEHVGLGGMNLAAGTYLRDRHVVSRGLSSEPANPCNRLWRVRRLSGNRWSSISTSTVASLYELAFLDVDLGHVSTDAGADGIDVAIDLGIVGILILAALPPENCGANDDEHHQHAQHGGKPGFALE